jgi:hypothetical protein
LQSFTEYILTTGNIPDRAVAKNKLPANTQARFLTPSYSLVALTTGQIFDNWGNHYFNLIAGSRDIAILSWASVAFHDQDTDYLLYTHAGEYAGTEFSASAWSLVASNRFAASNLPVRRPMTNFAVQVRAGQTQAFMVTHTVGGATLYPGAGEIVSGDFTLSIGKNFVRWNPDSIFEGGDETGDVGFAGDIGYCFDVCQSPVTNPTLAIAREGNEVVITWTAAGFTLQGSPTLGPANWTTAALASPARIPLSGVQQFFRLFRP